MASIRQKVHELDPDLALANVRTMDQWLSKSSAQPRLNTVLLSIFASLALLIAPLVPFYIYGTAYFSFLFADRLTAGSAVPWVSGLSFGIDAA